MYCPKCGAQNVNGAKFCRQCGTDVGIVAKALNGELVEKQPDTVEQMLSGMFEAGMKIAPLAPMMWNRKGAPDKQRKADIESHAKQPIERKAAKSVKEGAPNTTWAYISMFLGIAFLCISGVIGLDVPGGIYWWFWLLIPSFAMFGASIGEFTRLRQAARLNQTMPHGERQIDTASSDKRTSELDAAETSDTTRDAIAGAPPSITELTTRHLFTNETNMPPTRAGERRTR